jgi:hypothetical protein
MKRKGLFARLLRHGPLANALRAPAGDSTAEGLVLGSRLPSPEVNSCLCVPGRTDQGSP